MKKKKLLKVFNLSALLMHVCPNILLYKMLIFEVGKIKRLSVAVADEMIKLFKAS